MTEALKYIKGIVKQEKEELQNALKNGMNPYANDCCMDIIRMLETRLKVAALIEKDEKKNVSK